ncbi:MAG: Ammonia channel [Acidimicrobiales bacterium]|nr:MAG: ammonium transporter [Actinomycetota bacterium]MBV6507365.1 Ammonia channel [Acidimicrobiales bacterium]RIK04494.1 MAG: ammonium transporter [Acidobacteriota bacterium]
MKRKVLMAGVLALTAVLAFTTPAFAQDADPVVVLGQRVNLMWVIIGAALVIFMQAGFAMVETGFCRARHATHVVSTNFMVFGLGFVAFFLVGYSLMFGGYFYVVPGFDFGYDQPVGDALIKFGDWVFLWKGGFAGSFFDGGNLAYSGAVLGFFLYMVAFMDTTATIPTGSMAERWRWKSFVLWGVFCGALYYPVFGAWTWGGGWLSQLGNNLGLGNGYVDFAGSGIVHAMGGVAALAGALVLGPRVGKFGKDGKPRGLPGHSIPLAMLGTFILLFGWFGFNAASTLAATDAQLATVAANTALAAAFGSVLAMLWSTWRLGKPDPGMMANGMLAGLVAITAPCAFVDPWVAALVGAVAGVVVIEAILLLERRFKVDDPVGAISVHGVCGVLGVLSVGLFANGKYGIDAIAPGVGWNGTTNNLNADGAANGVTGLFYGDGGQLIAQLIGAATIIVVMGGVAFAFFKIQHRLTRGGIRSDREDEINGLDLPEMGVQAYPDFVGTHEGYGVPEAPATTSAGDRQLTQA